MTTVALDGRRLQDTPLTGVGRWIANLLPHLADEVEIVLLTDKRRPPWEGADFEQIPLAVPENLPEPVWLQVSAARWLRRFHGVFHGTYNATPMAYRGPSVLSLYDLTWEHHPEDLSPARRLSFLTQARWSARRAAAVLTISAHARASIIETYRLPAERVLLAPPSVDPIFSPHRKEDLPPLLGRLGIERPYVIALGGAKRRGLEVAVEAWRRLPAGPDRPSLVVVGTDSPSVGQGIVHTGRLDDGDWSALLAGATVFCYPTRFEGFGMPALESAASGIPVVCARIGPLPEVLGEAAEWCDTASVPDIAAALARVVGDPDRQKTLREAGLARAAAAPSWASSAKVVCDAYRMAAQ